eukprot:4423824-Alexandrium_andersonii.AAC.1
MCKIEGRLSGTEGYFREVRSLDRAIRWAPTGFRYEADPRHAEKLARDLLQAADAGLVEPVRSVWCVVEAADA